MTIYLLAERNMLVECRKLMIVIVTAESVSKEGLLYDEIALVSCFRYEGSADFR